jgi:hypothetical protein
MTIKAVIPQIDAYLHKLKTENPGHFIDGRMNLEETFTHLGSCGARYLFDSENDRILAVYTRLMMPAAAGCQLI